MNTKDATTPIVETSPTTPTLPAAAAGPNTYEDCVLIIDNLKDEKEPANLQAGLKKLHGFFTQRMGKKKQEDDRDGSASVKRAMAARPGFTKYEKKEVMSEAAPVSLL